VVGKKESVVVVVASRSKSGLISWSPSDHPIDSIRTTEPSLELLSSIRKHLWSDLAYVDVSSSPNVTNLNIATSCYFKIPSLFGST